MPLILWQTYFENKLDPLLKYSIKKIISDLKMENTTKKFNYGTHCNILYVRYKKEKVYTYCVKVF